MYLPKQFHFGRILVFEKQKTPCYKYPFKSSDISKLFGKFTNYKHNTDCLTWKAVFVQFLPTCLAYGKKLPSKDIARLNTWSDIVQNLFLLNKPTDLLYRQQLQTTHIQYGPEFISSLETETLAPNFGSSLLYVSKFNVLVWTFYESGQLS